MASLNLKNAVTRVVKPLPPELMIAAAAMGVARAFLRPSRRGRNAKKVAMPIRRREEGRGEVPGKATGSTNSRGWLGFIFRIYQCLQNDRVLLVAAGVTFYGLLALFPATAAVVSLYGLFSDSSTINEHMRLISGFLPEGAIQVIGDQVGRIAAQSRGTLGGAFFGTLALSLWGANAGTKAIFDALNIIFKEDEKGSFIQLTARSLAVTIGAVLLVLTAMTAIVAVPVLIKMLGIPEWSGAAVLSLLRWPLLYVMILFALACLYRFGPSRSHPRWRWITWGSTFAASAWLIGSLLLSWYVANFGTYNATYGSLGAVIGFMIWMWLSTIVVLVGAEIDAEVESWTVSRRAGA